MNKTSIIILTYNNLEYNKLCIESIRKMTPDGSYEIIVIDNHSTDGTAEWLNEQSDIKLILNDENKGFPAGCNQGINAAQDDNDILLLNNDTIVTPNWLDNLQTCLYSDASIGAVGPLTNSCSNFQSIPCDYTDFTDLITFANTINVSNPSKWEERVRLIGFCLLVKNETVKKIGLLDEIYGKGNYEDDDYSLRIRKAGYKLMLCEDCFIHHFGSTSFSKQKTGFNDILEINRKKFASKWGVDPMLFAIDERYMIAPYTNKIEAAKNILVVNSGCGSLLLYLKKIVPECSLTGTEKNKELSFALSHTAKIFDDLESIKEKKFNLIIFLSIMRPDIDMSYQIKQLPAMLADGGAILLISDRKDCKDFASLPCFDAFAKTSSSGTILLESLPPVAVTTTGHKEILAHDFSITPETAFGDQLAFLLRRIENGIDEDKSTANLQNLLLSKSFSNKSIAKIVNNSVIHKAVAFNTVGTVYYNAGNKQQALEMFVNANSADKTYRDGAFNLAYVLYEAQEKSLALKVINECSSTDDEMGQLRQAVLALS